jgi:hypothetical protein
LTPAPLDAPNNQEADHHLAHHQQHNGLGYAETVLTEPAVSDMPIPDSCGLGAEWGTVLVS